MGWDGPIVTDSGGFQVFSMGHGTVAEEIKSRRSRGARRRMAAGRRAGTDWRGGPGSRTRRSRPGSARRGEREGAILAIEEEGVRFRSYVDGRERFLSPEGSMATQAALGSDMALVFDECTPFHVDRDYTQRSTERTHRWLERCLGWHAEHGPRGAARVRDRAGRRVRGPAARVHAARSRRARATGSRSAARSGRRRRRCTRWWARRRASLGASTSTSRGTCWGSARWTT